MARHTFFIAGTDTDAGKTLVTAGLLARARQQGLATVAMKPVAAGCASTPEGLRNDDAMILQAEMTAELAYEQVNPIALAPPIAPHLAAQQAGKRLVVSQLAGFCRGLMLQPADLMLIEGAGGWRVPLNRSETLADLARELQLPVILVVGLKLGCINHALLTAEAIARDGLVLAGWVGNARDSGMDAYEDNIRTLEALLPAPCLGVVPVLEAPSGASAAPHLNLDLVITY